MDINGFKIKKGKIEKLWVIIGFSFCVAVILVILSFYIVFNKEKKIDINNSLKNMLSYHLKYNMIVYSNKNNNKYNVQEYYLNENNNESYRFDLENDFLKYSYILANNNIMIKKDNEINNYAKYEYISKLDNIFSINCYIKLYNIICNDTSNKYNKYFKIENVTKDNEQSIKISIKSDIVKDTDYIEKIENEYLKEFVKKCVQKENILSLEIIINLKDNLITNYYIYKGDKIHIEIEYSEFQINPKIGKKVFSFLT